MGQWFQDNIIEPGKLGALLCLAAFVITFVATRVITRLIRAGVGPFKNNVSSGGLHVHHAIPGIILLIVGALMAISSEGAPWTEIAAVMIGVGTSLILDEFALILRLQDVYWAEEGRISVEMIGLTGACLGFVILGFSPFAVTDLNADAFGFRIVLVVGYAVHGAVVLICVLKGKYRAALIGCFIPFVNWICAARLARPTSWWARHFYGERRRRKARARSVQFEKRWGARWRWLGDVIAGSPTTLKPETEPVHRDSAPTVEQSAPGVR